MLRKLLKYDLRANIKIFLFIWPAIIAFAFLERLVIGAELNDLLSTMLIALTSTLFVLAVVAACVFAFIICVIRFYSGLLRREGYLMFTLPVKPWQLLVSKFLTALLTITVTLLLSVAAVLILFSGIDGFCRGMQEVLAQIGAFLDVMPCILMGLLVLSSISVNILRIYFVCCLGHLCRRARIFFSILFYYMINVLSQFISIAAMIILSIGIDNNWFDLNAVEALVEKVSPGEAVSLLLGILLLLNLAVGAVYYLVSERILRKRLNLE